MLNFRTRFYAGLIAGAAVAGGAWAQPPAELAGRIAALGRAINPPATAAIYGPLQPAISAEASVRRDAAYGPGVKQTMDVFTPAARGPARPILIFVHGGGFMRDDKSRFADGSRSPFYDNVMLWAVGHGMVGVNMNYGLAPQAAFPDAQRDIATVVAWARKNTASLGGDPDRVILWGHSAGASHVASFLAHPETYRDIDQKPVRAAVLHSGVYDMAGNPQDHVYFGPVAGLAERSSVQGLVRSKVPVLVLAAELDPVEMVAQARQLDMALTEGGRDHQLAIAGQHAHMSEIYSVNTADETVSGPVLAFLARAP